MKQKIFFVFLFAAIALAAGWNMIQSENDMNLSDVALANVEALARSETGLSDCSTYCTPANGYTCIIRWPGADGITCYSHRKG